jgi:hypothetical protein
MALCGNSDLVTEAGTIEIDLSAKQVNGNSTSFQGAGVDENDVITVGTGATYGEAVVASVTNDTTLILKSTEYLVPDPVTGLIPVSTPYYISEKPISTLSDGGQYDADEIFGIDTAEQAAANAQLGSSDLRKFAPPHAGWVGITSYYDADNNLRVKTEVLVAGSHVTSDNNADDDRFLP